MKMTTFPHTIGGRPHGHRPVVRLEEEARVALPRVALKLAEGADFNQGLVRKNGSARPARSAGAHDPVTVPPVVGEVYLL
jgi:hypothetical protein